MVRSPHTPRSLGAALASGTLILALVGAPLALAGPTVTVRVEGESATLLPPTKVTLSAPEPVSGCAANSVAAAINLAVNGNWDHGEANKGGGGFTEAILGETHAFVHESDTWAEWVNYKWGGGICSDLLGNGDEVLMVADHEPEPFYAPTVLPLEVTEAPSVVQVGAPFTVKVSQIRTPPGAFAEAGQGTPESAPGAIPAGEGALGQPAVGDGKATITLTKAGSSTLRATKAGDAPSAPFVVCAHDGNDGNCGTVAASGSSSTSGSNSAATGATAPAIPFTGQYAVVAHIQGLLEGHLYGRGQAEALRLLHGTVDQHTQLRDVQIRLTRTSARGCAFYDALSERFHRMRCGAAHGAFFSLGNHTEFSYLLPTALAPGRYVLDVRASDAAGNRSTLARGTSRIVFYVR